LKFYHEVHEGHKVENKNDLALIFVHFVRFVVNEINNTSLAGQ
jgi:hypothetical protein